jgi:AcrR family transcriptional regulator
MNHLPLRSVSTLAKVRRPTQRALAKQRTREKILASAKALFAEKGYEGATIRDIASAAGMSTGAVFASFTDKSDLFNDIISAERDALYDTMEAALVGCSRLDTALGAMFDAGYRLILDDLPLLQATVGVSWSPTMGGQVRARLARRPITDLIAAALNAATARGELKPSANVALISQMLWDCYLSSFGQAAFENWDAADLRTQLGEQIGLVLAGVRAG